MSRGGLTAAPQESVERAGLKSTASPDVPTSTVAEALCDAPGSCSPIGPPALPPASAEASSCRSRRPRISRFGGLERALLLEFLRLEGRAEFPPRIQGTEHCQNASAVLTTRAFSENPCVPVMLSDPISDRPVMTSERAVMRTGSAAAGETAKGQEREQEDSYSTPQHDHLPISKCTTCRCKGTRNLTVIRCGRRPGDPTLRYHAHVHHRAGTGRRRPPASCAM